MRRPTLHEKGLVCPDFEYIRISWNTLGFEVSAPSVSKEFGDIEMRCRCANFSICAPCYEREIGNVICSASGVRTAQKGLGENVMELKAVSCASMVERNRKSRLPVLSAGLSEGKKHSFEKGTPRLRPSSSSGETSSTYHLLTEAIYRIRGSTTVTQGGEILI